MQTLNQIIEKPNKHNLSLCTCFFDYEEALGIVDNFAIFQALRRKKKHQQQQTNKTNNQITETYTDI